jgi:hypothetical protein
MRDIFSPKSEGKCLGVLGVGGKIIWKLIYKILICGCGLDLPGSGQWSVARPCIHGNGLFVFQKIRLISWSAERLSTSQGNWMSFWLSFCSLVELLIIRNILDSVSGALRCLDLVSRLVSWCGVTLTREWSDPTCRNLPWFFFHYKSTHNKVHCQILAANTHCKYCRWNENWEGRPKYSEKTCLSSTISHDLTWPRTQAAKVGSRRLTAWGMARPQSGVDPVVSFTISRTKR